ncbi:excinuclease ATPase subunit [Bifidobacterium saguini DSM 23967]|uniref:UvrABC system protein A n=3 Tax=Bifidobacterium TaxID=1678 RepID=A0A2N5ITP9_9BIFI|nr:MULTISPECIES: excinuclease ABC subunit A [Bifidobacterium]KFI94092.1 excinuclease ATPase subunit [Bifidobacterium saguini DSM 23967]PLS25311.1 excinuclease ABC subunit A [Bifidobacterium imperatoris]QSY57928.1 excinuclease ABC subunit UvrA [Bifidobacterium imperatoris]QTB90396.1 excinuclease ABC subunit UvrA [Bifidobacterium saguini]
MTQGQQQKPTTIEVRGARVHNLKNINVDVPLGELVGIAGVSGSGKSSLALGVLYAEGSRRYLEALSTYTRRRLTQASRAQVDEVLHVPAALALHQRPAVPGIRSTFGTMTELLNSLRLLFSRCASHVCPYCGARQKPTLNVAAELPMICISCGKEFQAPGAESLAFNSAGACPTCSGTGIVREVNRAALVPDESKSIDDGAVLPWGSLMWDLMKQVCGAMGVRTNVPFKELTPEERDIVFNGPAVKKHILYRPKKGDDFAELDFTYYNAVYTVENALAKAKDEQGLKRVARFLEEKPCHDCGGTRLSSAARGPEIRGINLAQATAMTLDDAVAWMHGVPESLPVDMRPMATNICESFLDVAKRLLELGLGYLALDRAGSTLSTGERQRVQLARAVRNRTTGVLYVLDEPSIGLHPSNVDGLLGVMHDLVADGNSVVVVDHDVRVLKAADHLIEMGPVAGAGGGYVIAQGAVSEVAHNANSRIAPFLSEDGQQRIRARVAVHDDSSETMPQPSRPEAASTESSMFANGRIHMETGSLHTVKPLTVDIPRGRLVAVTGVSGSGKTTMVLESLIPALKAAAAGESLPKHVHALQADGITRANLIDATPIGANVRSTVATYAGIHDELRRAFARCEEAKAAGYKAGDFSYNTGRLRCPTCDGTGSISLDVQFLPDVTIACPDCQGSRYAPEASTIHRQVKAAKSSTGRKTAKNVADESGNAVTSDVFEVSRLLTLPQLMSMSVDEALAVTADMRKVHARLITLHDLGLGYLTLGEPTPSLSGGEAQRLKLASEMGRAQSDAVFVFDEPTIGLHPLDVQVLLGVFDRLMASGATVVVIEHDLDVIANADWVIDLGPGGGEAGGRIIATGTPEQIASDPVSITGRYLSVR